MPVIDLPIRLYQGDCLEVLPKLNRRFVDLILCDPPYGTTANPWDSVIPLDELWGWLRRVQKVRSPTILFSTQPFTTELISSNRDYYRNEWIWNKSKITGVLNAPIAPVRNHENVTVFAINSKYTFNQWNVKPIENPTRKGQSSSSSFGERGKYGYLQKATGVHRSCLKINSEGSTIHPTQKPVALMEYFIKTYSNEGDTVLDFAMGSGTTGVACKNLNRRFIGIEKDPVYFELAKERIANA